MAAASGRRYAWAVLAAIGLHFLAGPHGVWAGPLVLAGTGATQFCDDLRATKPVDPAQPVMVAGDRQWNNAATRMAQGIPVGPGRLNQVRQSAQARAAPWVLD